MVNYTLYIILFSSLLFLFMSFFIKREYRWLAVIINIIFFFSMYINTSILLGQSKPLEYNIPLYTHNWEINPPDILAYYISRDYTRIYLMLYDNGVKFYSMPFNQDFYNELNNALQKNSTLANVKFKNGMKYGDGSGGGFHVIAPDSNGGYEKPTSDQNGDIYQTR